MGKEGHCRQTSLVCVGSTRSVPATLGLTPLTVCVLSLSTLLRLQAALQGAGPEVRALPRPKPLRFRFSGTPQRCRLGWACVLCLHRPEQLRQPGAWGAHSPRVWFALSPPWSQPQSPRTSLVCLCLFWGADFWLRPSQQMSTNQNLRKSLVRDWKPVCSLVGDALSGAEFAPFPFSLPPASGGGWACPQQASSSLELLSPSFVLWMGWQYLQFGLFAG